VVAVIESENTSPVAPPDVPERLQEAAAWVRPKPPAPRPASPRRSVPELYQDLSVAELAHWACVSYQHARMVKSGIRKASAQMEKLVRLHRSGRIMPESWSEADWSFDGARGREELRGPDGLRFKPAEVLALPYLRSALHAHEVEQRLFREDAFRLRELRHTVQKLRSAFLQIGASVSEAEDSLAHGFSSKLIDDAGASCAPGASPERS
jgi:hypothetical protein